MTPPATKAPVVPLYGRRPEPTDPAPTPPPRDPLAAAIGALLADEKAGA